MSDRSERDSLPPIKFKELADALLANIETLVPVWLPGGKRNGHEWVCGSLSGGAGSSCSVNMTTGQWADFSTDEKGGDLVGLYAAMHGLAMGKAALQVARDEGLEDVAGVQGDAAHQRIERPAPPPAAPKPRSDEGWKTVRPVPTNAPPPTFRHHHRKPEDIMRRAEYRVGDDLHGYVVRFATSTGGKDDLPYTWCQSTKDGSLKWQWKQFDAPRPLYLPGHALPGGRTVVLVEGEKKAEVLQQLLDAVAPGVYCVASWPGGCKAWAKADWSWLQGCTVLAWPDCDSKRVPLTAKERNACPDDAALKAAEAAQPYLPRNKQPGMAAMIGIGHHLVAEHGCTVSLLAIDDPGIKPDGWDAADAIQTDGWDFDRVLAFFATAHALPPVDGDAAKLTTPPAAEKSARSPVGTRAGDDAGSGVKDDVVTDLPWWLRGYWDADKKRWNISRKTIIAALRNDEELAGSLGFNLLSNTIELKRDWPMPRALAGELKDGVELQLNDWLSNKYKIPSTGVMNLVEAMKTVADENEWHPVRDWLKTLAHDGISRIDKWLIFAIGETPETLSPYMVEYLSLVGRYWLLGMVYRVMQPGCKFDYCPVLEGGGGLGKSTLVKVLTSKAWFSDTHFRIGQGKEAQEQVQGVWGYELGELSVMGKSEINEIKNFISSEEDRYRPAYARVPGKFPRQCVLVGTTNESTYLRDRTGNRRFWPIPVLQRIKTTWVTRWRDQLFAEAYALYLQGAQYTPSVEQETRLFVPMQESRLVESAVTSELLTVLTRPPGTGTMGDTVNELTDFVTIDMLCKALGADSGKAPAGMQGEIRTWMNAQGWPYKKSQVNNVRRPGWHRPKDWPPEDFGPGTPGEEAQTGPAPASAVASAPPPPPLSDDAPF